MSQRIVSAVVIKIVVFCSIVYVCAAACRSGFFYSQSECMNCPEHCISCNSSENCFTCEDGFLGITCTRKCEHCKPGTKCEPDSGYCTDGCKDGLSGRHCNISCDNRCLSCTRHNASKCNTCKYIQNCDLDCPTHCLGNICIGSYCIKGCLPGYFGESCEHDCSASCVGGCDREDGTCSKDKDCLSSCGSLLVLVSILFVLLVVAACRVVYLVCRQRCTRTESREISGHVQGTEVSRDTQLLSSSTAHGIMGPAAGGEDLSYLTPACSHVNSRHYYVVPTSTTTHPESQNKADPGNASKTQIYEHQYEEMK